MGRRRPHRLGLDTHHPRRRLRRRCFVLDRRRYSQTRELIIPTHSRNSSEGKLLTCIQHSIIIVLLLSGRDHFKDIDGVDAISLDSVFFDFDNGRAAQKARFGAEFFPAQAPQRLKTFLDFFQVDKETGRPKGIVELLLDNEK